MTNMRYGTRQRCRLNICSHIINTTNTSTNTDTAVLSRLYTTFLGSTGLCWAKLVCNWLYRAALGCTGAFWSVLGCPGGSGGPGGKSVPENPQGQVGLG